MLRALAAIVVASFAACAPLTPAPTPPAVALAELAAAGKLRAAINFGNPILATRDPATGEARGVSVDLARELGRRLGVQVELVLYTSAGQVFEGATKNAWDVAFLAIDPVRERDLAFTAPYVIIEGAYLVPVASPIRENAQVDRDGVKIVVGNGSAYDLHLSRELRRATLVRAPTSPLVVDTMLAQRADVAAGVRQQLEADAKRIAGVRVLDGRFMVIEQAMATPRQRAAAARYLAEFVEAMKADGFVARALARHDVSGVTIAPAAPH